MRGHIRRRNKDTWTVVVELPRDPITKKRRQKWVSVKGTKKEAEKELVRLINEIETGFYTEPSKMTFGEYLDLWLKTVKDKVKETTYSEYSDRIKKWQKTKVAVKPLQKIIPADIEYVLSEFTSVGQERKKMLLITLKTALNEAVLLGIINNNPASVVKNPKINKKEVRVWTKEEALEFLKVAQKSRYFTLFYLALKTGLRRGELLALQWEDINFKEGRIYVKHTLAYVNQKFILQSPKTRSAKRSVPVDTFTVEILKKQKKKCVEESLKLGKGQIPRVFWTGRTGRPLHPANVDVIFKNLIKKTKVPVIRFHDLRHTHATFLLEKNVHPKIVAERLGHSSIQITLDRYSHVLPDTQKEAVKAIENIGF